MLGGAFTPIYRPRGARRLRHDDGNGEEVAASGEFVWAPIFYFRIGSDTRDIGRSSGSFHASGASLSSTRIVAYWLRRAVDAGEDDGASFLLLHEF